MAGFSARGIRFRVTAVATVGALLVGAMVVVTTAFAMRSVLEQTITNDLSDHLDKAQEAVEAGNPELAVQFAGSDIMQVIDENGEVIASSANARNLAAIVEDWNDDDAVELANMRLRESNGANSAASSGEPAGQNSESAPDVQAAENAAAAAAAAAAAYVPPVAPAADYDDGPDEPDPEPDDDPDPDPDPDDDAKVREQAASAPAAVVVEPDNRNYAEPVEVEDYGDDFGDDYDSDDYDDDIDYDADADADDDFDADADDSDADDADDADDDRSTRGIPAPPVSLVPRAYAAEPEPADNASYVDASNLFGDEGPYLVMQRKIDAPDGAVTLAAMTSLAPAMHGAQAAAQLIAIIMAVLLVAVAVAVWFLAGRTLRPVEEMRASVAEINASDLSVRVPIPRQDPDLAPLAQTFNELLGRIESALDMQRRFLSDASHELKSPIAASSLMLEAMREYPELVDDQQVIEDLSGENARMERIVGNMLVLERIDEGRLEVSPAPIDLLDVLLEEVAVLSGNGRIPIDASAVQPLICVADREQLSHVVRNLLDNAQKYAASTVRLSCEEVDGNVRITVSDDGPGIPEKDRDRVFDRFVRLEEGDARRKESTGLGLSVARSSASQIGGTVRFVDPELGGATAILEFPLVDDASPLG